MVVTCRATNEPVESNPVKWEGDFAVGATADVSVHEKKDYGLVFDFSAHPDVLGLAAKHQVCHPLVWSSLHQQPELCCHVVGSCQYWCSQ